MPQSEAKLHYEVNAPDDIYTVEAHQIDVDVEGNLRFFEYKTKDGYALPQLTTIAVWPHGRWLHVREITEQEAKELQDLNA